MEELLLICLIAELTLPERSIFCPLMVIEELVILSAPVRFCLDALRADLVAFLISCVPCLD